MQTDIRGRISAQLLTFVISTFRPSPARKVRIALIAEEGLTTLITLADVVIFRLPAPCSGFRLMPFAARRSILLASRSEGVS